MFVSVYNIQDETGQFKPYPASNFSTAVPQTSMAMLVTALKVSRCFNPRVPQVLKTPLKGQNFLGAPKKRAGG
ncbi:curli production assembly/transport protein CsgG, partial [Escherichia coli]|nr:curli production assembly/transport protein CsgG [Escherichia coli]